MPSLVRKSDNPVGHVGRYLAGTGNLMLAGAVGFNYALRSSQGEPGLLVAAICALAALVTGFQGFAAMRDFVRSAPNRVLGVILATATGLFALLSGGLLGAVLVSIIGDTIFS